MDAIVAEQGCAVELCARSVAEPGIRSVPHSRGPVRRRDAGAMLPWQNGLRMAASDHLVLATESDDDRCFGVIAASEPGNRAGAIPFPRRGLPAAGRARVLPAAAHAGFRHAARRRLRHGAERHRRLRADTLLRAACCGTFGQRFSAASLFPAVPGDVVIDLGMASLARRDRARRAARDRAARPPTVPLRQAASLRAMPQRGPPRMDGDAGRARPEHGGRCGHPRRRAQAVPRAAIGRPRAATWSMPPWRPMLATAAPVAGRHRALISHAAAARTARCRGRTTTARRPRSAARADTSPRRAHASDVRDTATIASPAGPGSPPGRT